MPRLESCYHCKQVYITRSAPYNHHLWVCNTGWQSLSPAPSRPSAGATSPLIGSSSWVTYSAPSFLYSLSLSHLRGVSPSKTRRLRISWKSQDFLSFRNLLVEVIFISLHCQAKPQLQLWPRLALIFISPPSHPPTQPPDRKSIKALALKKYVNTI